MLKFIQIFFVLVLFISNDVEANKFTIMSINAQNLFDTIDDPKKDDKAFLPIELKQSKLHKNECNNINVKRWRMECFFQDWNKETKYAKLNNLVEVIISYGGNGADVLLGGLGQNTFSNADDGFMDILIIK